MRLSWKLFFITTPLFVLFLTIFGIWMIQENFTVNLNEEIDRCMSENQMFLNSWELTQHSLTEAQRGQATTERIVQSFYQAEKAKYKVCIFKEDGEILYTSDERYIENSVAEQLDETNNVGYELVRAKDRIFAVVVCRSTSGIYIETVQDITAVFRQRDSMYARYQRGVLAMAFLVGGLTLLLLFLVMNNMQKLSKATRQFAQGQYDTRVNIRSTDEIGMLAADFNWMADEMNSQLERLQSEVQRQEEFTSAFSHELKTPLTSIIGYADTIRSMELTPEEINMCADYIYHQGKRLQSLSYKLLEMTMADKQDIAMRTIKVPELLRDVERTVRVSLIEKQVELELDVQEGIVVGDRDLLASVFINLIDNARKASKSGSRIWLTGTVLRDGYCVTVEDEAGGIPGEALSRITEAFYMVDKSRARKEGGAGLGLALSQKIVNIHQAAMRFENTGQGLRVTVQFAIPGGLQGGRKIKRRRGGIPVLSGHARGTKEITKAK